MKHKSSSLLLRKIAQHKEGSITLKLHYGNHAKVVARIEDLKMVKVILINLAST